MIWRKANGVFVLSILCTPTLKDQAGGLKWPSEMDAGNRNRTNNYV